MSALVKLSAVETAAAIASKQVSAVEVTDAHYDLIIIGTGAGGGTMAHALASTGARILLIERGDFVPQEPENFLHRIGRTGRAGARGASWTFVTPLQRSDVRSYERKLGIQVQYRELPALPRPIGLVPDVQAFLAAMSAAQPPSNEPKPTPTKTFSSSRRRRR